MTWGVVLFHTTSSALRAEKILIKAGLRVKLIPTPRELSSDCGMALRFEFSEQIEVKQQLAAAGIEMAIHPLS